MNGRKEMSIRLAFSVLMPALVLAVPAGAVTHHVSPGQSIQAAIDAASNGDEIEVAAGTYKEAINFKGKAVRLYSSGGADVTTINGTGNYHVVQCVSGEDANTILEGFTITGGNANGSDTNSLGGGIYCGNSSPTVTNSRFFNNRAEKDGGGMYNYYCSPTVTNCTFGNNESRWNGGGMVNAYSSPTVTNCIFISNSTVDYDGGGMANAYSSPTVTNCTFSGNSAAEYGGGIFNYDSSPTVINCTFSGNTAGTDGGGIGNANSSSPTVVNCILWKDAPNEIYPFSSFPTVTYSDIQGGWPGTRNIDSDPHFVNAAGGDLRLSWSGSACVDAGDNNAPGLPATDLAGKPRVVDGDRDGTATVDMGAYELQFLPIHNITQNVFYRVIQNALDDAKSGDQIEVGPGTYYEAIDFKGKAVGLYSRKGPEFTIINGTGNYHVVQCISSEGRNTILEGFTITGGHAKGAVIPDNSGGGILCVWSSPTIVNCIISENVAVHGGGIYGAYSNLAIIGCKISDNWGTFNGGGLYFYWFYPVMINCEIRNNKTNYGGGGMVSDYSQPTITNSTFSANVTYDGGSGALASLADGAGNTPYITNCILWGDTPPEIAYATFPPVVKYCDVQGGVWPLTGNISVDPLFANAAGGNLQLSPGSHCIDKGYNAVDTDVYTADVQPLPEDDLNGSPRIYPSVVDMGAYEHRDSDGDGITDGFDTPSVHNLTRGTDHFTVQAAINSAKGGDEIAADQGRYNESVNFKGKTVILRSNEPNDPNVVAKTIIDATGLASSVVLCAGGEGPNTVLSGFTITGGSGVNGGGMFNSGSSPTVTKCVFTGNSATNGGGMLNIDCAPKVTGCIFKNNVASGVAIGGGGMYNHNSSPLVTDCSFIGNLGEVWGGGGMFNAVGSNPTVINCTFSNNNAVYGGGGIYNWDDTMPILINCTFSGNSATWYGGGMFNINNSRPTVTGCSFNENTSQFGGGIYSESSSPAITNCVFRNNDATNSGGGMCDSNSSPTIINCTFSGNSADIGGGMCNSTSSSPTVVNCILWGDTADEIHDDASSTTTVSYSDVQGHSVYPGKENINADPFFVDANNPDPNLVNLRLSPDSLCIDKGDNNTPNLPDGDMDGHSRIIDGDCDESAVADMGAYEFNYAYMGDLDYNCRVDFFDFSIFSRAWMAQEGDPGWDWACDISEPPDDYIDWRDVAVLCENWLATP